MTRRMYAKILTQYTDSTQFGISNDNYQADSSSAGASTASATTTPMVNIKGPVSAQAVSASDAVSSAASSAASAVASVSSSAASQMSSVASSVASSGSAAMTSASVSQLRIPMLIDLSDCFCRAQCPPWLLASTALPLVPHPAPPAP